MNTTDVRNSKSKAKAKGMTPAQTAASAAQNIKKSATRPGLIMPNANATSGSSPNASSQSPGGGTSASPGDAVGGTSASPVGAGIGTSANAGEAGLSSPPPSPSPSSSSSSSSSPSSSSSSDSGSPRNILPPLMLPAPTIQLVSSTETKKLTFDRLNHEGLLEVQSCFRVMRDADPTFSHVRLIDPDLTSLLTLDFGDTSWKQMDSEDFFRVMLCEYPTEKNTSDSSLEERFRQIDKKLFKIDLKNPKCYNALFLQVMKIMEVEDAIPVNEKRVTDLCSILTNKIGKDNTLNKQMWEHMSVKTFKPTSINEWFERTRAEMRRLYGAMVCLESYGVKIGSDNNNHDRTKHDDKPKFKQDRLDKKEDKFPQSTKRNYEKLRD